MKRRSGWSIAQPRIKAGDGFIYLAEIIGSGYVKIGFSLNPRSRIRQLWTYLIGGGKARLLAQTPGSWQQEMALHRVLPDGRHEFYPRSILSHPAIPAEFRVHAKRPPAHRDARRRAA